MSLNPFRRLDCMVLMIALAGVGFVFVGNCNPPPSVPEPQPDSLPDVIYVRPLIKDRLARDVAAGRRSLFDAASLFAQLNRLPPEYRPVLPLEFGFSDAEQACHQVMNWVEAMLASEKRTAQTLTRLKAEFEQAQAQPGGLRLPAAESLESVEVLLAQARQRLPATLNGPAGTESKAKTIGQ